MSYIQIPKTIDFMTLSQKSSFSCKNYEGVFVSNKNVKKVGDLLTRELRGREIGSSAYISHSPYYFVRTGALNAQSFVLSTKQESLVPMNPGQYTDMNMKQGQIIISKDGNIGECVMIEKDLTHLQLCGGLVCIDIESSMKDYCFAFMKSNFFKDQLYQKVSKGATLLHAKDLRKDCIIPFPNQTNNADIISYISLLVQSVIRKEQEIKKKYESMMEMIEKELGNNQKDKEYIYQVGYKNLMEYKRLDTGMYKKNFQITLHRLNNYIYGSQKILDLGYKTKRGQNLQITAIGKCIESDIYRTGFYKLITSTDLTDYGTHGDFRYRGNAKKLSEIHSGDIMFSATGQAETSVGKVCIFVNPPEKLISNINSFFLSNKNTSIVDNIYVGVILMRYKYIGFYVDLVGRGNGGSFTEPHFEYVYIPNFPDDLKQRIASQYYTPTSYPEHISLENFVIIDETITTQSGIIQLDTQIKVIKTHLNTLIDQIIRDEEVVVDWGFLHTIQ